MKFFDKFFGDADAKTIKKIQPIVDQINGLEDTIKALSESWSCETEPNPYG